MRALTFPTLVLMVMLSGVACQPNQPDLDMTDAPFTQASSAQLAEAVAQGDTWAIQEQIRQGSSPDAQGEDGLNLLQHAILSHSRAGLEALLDSGADPDLPGFDGSTALHTAAIDDDPAYLALLLTHGGDPNAPHAVTGERPLAKAVGPRTATQFRALLDAGADPNLADRTGNTPLHRAAMVNAGAHVLELLEAGANPQARNAQDRSFQSYYFGVPDNVLSERARGERAAIIRWLREHEISLEAGVDDT